MDKTAKFKRLAVIGGLGYLGYRGARGGIERSRRPKVDPTRYSGHLYSNVVAGKINPRALSQRELGMVTSLSQAKTASEKARIIVDSKNSIEKTAKIGLLGTALTGSWALSEYGEARDKYRNMAGHRLGSQFARPMQPSRIGSGFRGTRQSFAQRSFY